MLGMHYEWKNKSKIDETKAAPTNNFELIYKIEFLFLENLSRNIEF